LIALAQIPKRSFLIKIIQTQILFREKEGKKHLIMAYLSLTFPPIYTFFPLSLITQIEEQQDFLIHYFYRIKKKKATGIFHLREVKKEKIFTHKKYKS